MDAQLGQKCWDPVSGKNVYEDAVGPATSSQGFSVLVDAELVRTALKREQSVLRAEF